MKYRKKPIEIEAVQFLGDSNLLECLQFLSKGDVTGGGDNNIIIITTLEGDMTCSKNDWIIRGIKGEFYPCKPDIFKETYEEVESNLTPKR